MKYHVTVACNDVFRELVGSRSPCSLEDINEPCTAVIVKKRTDLPSFCTLLILSVLQLGSNQSTSSCQRVFENMDFEEF